MLCKDYYPTINFAIMYSIMHYFKANNSDGVSYWVGGQLAEAELSVLYVEGLGAMSQEKFDFKIAF